MPVSKKRKKKNKKKVNPNNNIKKNIKNLDLDSSININYPYSVMFEEEYDISEDVDKEITRVPSRKGNWIVFKNTDNAHLEIVEDDEVEPGTLMKDSGFPNAKYFSEDTVIIKDMTPNTYDYVTKYGYELCYNGGRIGSTLSRMYDDEIDKVYAIYNPNETETPYQVFADIYVSGYDYHELCTIVSFRKKETLMRWLKTPVGAGDVADYTLELARTTEPSEEDSRYSFLNPEMQRGKRKMRELFAEKYPNNEDFSDKEIEDLFEEFRYDKYFNSVRGMIEFNKQVGKIKEYRFKDSLEF